MPHFLRAKRLVNDNYIGYFLRNLEHLSLLLMQMEANNLLQNLNK